MAVQKPSKPDVTLPNNFGGVKTPYTNSQISNGYQEAVPQVVDGGNINYEKDAVFKYLKYLKTVIDALVDMPIGKSIVIDANNRFEYISPENSANKTGTINASSTATQYPNAKAVYDAIKGFNPSLFQLISNLEQSLSTSTTKYPSSKAVKTAIDAIDVNADIKDYIKTVYPVGSLYFSTASTCPLQSLGIGTWKKVGTSLTLNVNTSVPVVGTDIAIGFTNGSSNRGLAMNNGSLGQSTFFPSLYGASVGTKAFSTDSPNGAVGLTKDASKSGIVGTVTRTQLTVNVFQRTA